MIMSGKIYFEDHPWPTVSDAAKDFIRALLSIDPAQRVSAAQAMCEDLSQSISYIM